MVGKADVGRQGDQGRVTERSLSRPLTDPQYWRDRAEEARAHAAEMSDPENQHMMLRVAEGHERQAELLERARERLTDGSLDR